MVSYLFFEKSNEELESFYSSYEYVTPRILQEVFGYSRSHSHRIIKSIKLAYNYDSPLARISMNIFKQYINDNK